MYRFIFWYLGRFLICWNLNVKIFLSLLRFSTMPQCHVRVSIINWGTSLKKRRVIYFYGHYSMFFSTFIKLFSSSLKMVSFFFFHNVNFDFFQTYPGNFWIFWCWKQNLFFQWKHLVNSCCLKILLQYDVWEVKNIIALLQEINHFLIKFTEYPVENLNWPKIAGRHSEQVIPMEFLTFQSRPPGENVWFNQKLEIMSNKTAGYHRNNVRLPNLIKMQF